MLAQSAARTAVTLQKRKKSQPRISDTVSSLLRRGHKFPYPNPTAPRCPRPAPSGAARLRSCARGRPRGCTCPRLAPICPRPHCSCSERRPAGMQPRRVQPRAARPAPASPGPVWPAGGCSPSLRGRGAPPAAGRSRCRAALCPRPLHRGSLGPAEPPRRQRRPRRPRALARPCWPAASSSAAPVPHGPGSDRLSPLWNSIPTPGCIGDQQAVGYQRDRPVVRSSLVIYSCPSFSISSPGEGTEWCLSPGLRDCCVQETDYWEPCV